MARFHECTIRLQQTSPSIYPRGVLKMNNSFYRDHAWFFEDQPKFMMTNNATGVTTKVRVLEWINSHTAARFRYLNCNAIVEEMQMTEGDIMRLQLSVHGEGSLFFTCLDHEGNPKAAPPIEHHSSDDDDVVELVDHIRPHIYFRVDAGSMKKQAIPKTFIESAGMEETRVLHLKPRGSRNRWMVELTKRRPKSYIYELKAGWEEFVYDNRLELDRRYYVYSEENDKHTLVFEINDIIHID